MCWNAQVSLNTFFVGAFAIILAVLNGYPPPLLWFFASFISVQLMEFFIWYNIDNKSINRICTMALLILILLVQPLMSILLLKKDHPTLMKYLLVAYSSVVGIIALLILLNGDIPDNKFYSIPGANGHLIWGWADTANIQTIYFYIMIAYLVFLFTPLIITKNYWIVAIVGATFILSVIFFWKYRTWGTMWCWTANIISLILIIKIILLSGKLCIR